MTRRHTVLGGILVFLALGSAAVALTRAPSAAREVVYAVPLGASARADTVSVLPSNIVLHVGDTLIIRNDDTAAVKVGPFLVEPGQRLVKTYQEAGVYDLECSVHPDGRLQIVVLADR
jgi:plastocyanin